MKSGCSSNRGIRERKLCLSETEQGKITFSKIVKNSNNPKLKLVYQSLVKVRKAASYRAFSIKEKCNFLILTFSERKTIYNV